jgi:hypothetical protein
MGWIIDFSTWKMKDKRAFGQAVVASNADDAALYPHFAACVKEWPYEALNPADVASYDELTILQYKEVANQVASALKSFINPDA